MCEHEVRATIKGHLLNPIERLASARELGDIHPHIEAWGKPVVTPTIENAAEPLPEALPATEDEAIDIEETDSQDAAA